MGAALGLGLLAGQAFAVDIAGRYVGKDGVVTIQRAQPNNLFFVDVEDKNNVCGFMAEMKFVGGKGKFMLVSDDPPMSLRFTKKGLVLDMPRDDALEECRDFALDKPFKRE